MKAPKKSPAKPATKKEVDELEDDVKPSSKKQINDDDDDFDLPIDDFETFGDFDDDDDDY